MSSAPHSGQNFAVSDIFPPHAGQNIVSSFASHSPIETGVRHAPDYATSSSGYSTMFEPS